jgi:hypothetical protein
MELQYYIEYIISWIYHNVINTGATFAIVRILIIVGLVSLLVYQQYILFVLLCIVVISAEFLILDEKPSSNTIKNMFSFEIGAITSSNREHKIVDKDELTTGVALTREGFSLGLPKIIKGDDSGIEYQRSNKFIEEDSRDFTDKYFSSKQCSIGSEVGGITMFGSNELIGDKRNAQINMVYDFAGNWTSNDPDPTVSDPEKRFKYFNDCVFEPIKRNDFRQLKKDLFENIMTSVIDIGKCFNRFDVNTLLNTESDITLDYSKRISLSDKKEGDQKVSDVAYVSIIQGNTNAKKLENIQALDKGPSGDNASDITYAALMKKTNERSDGIYNNAAVRQRAIDVYGKAFGYRKRIDEILARMREETKNDASKLYTVRVNENVIKELRQIFAYLALIKGCNSIIMFEQTSAKIYEKLDVTPPLTTLGPIVVTTTQTDPISGVNNIYRIPLDDDSYNTNDEKRYFYGITYYFNKVTSEKRYTP